MRRKVRVLVRRQMRIRRRIRAETYTLQVDKQASEEQSAVILIRLASASTYTNT